MGDAVIAVEGVSKTFERHGVPFTVLDDIDLDIRPAEFVCVIGHSGCGKTTLLNLIAGLEEPDGGRVMFDGREVTGPGSDRVVVFQEYGLFPWFTARQNVEFGLRQMKHPNVRERGDELIRTVGLEGFERSYPQKLSGGMRQRVALARALAVEPAAMLMDEPFGALDLLTRETMQEELLRLWSQTRKTIVFVTHGIEEAVHLADRIVVMSRNPGRIQTIVEVSPERPRSMRDPAVQDLCNLLGEQLRADESRSHQMTAGRDADV